MTLKLLAALCVSGAAGVLARYWVDGAISTRTSGSFPWGTLAINLSGSFLLGFLFTLMAERTAAPAWLRMGLTFGFLGAYTTFSTLSLETLRLLEARQLVPALANSAGSLVLGVFAAYLGVMLARVG